VATPVLFGRGIGVLLDSSPCFEIDLFPECDGVFQGAGAKRWFMPGRSLYPS